MRLARTAWDDAKRLTVDRPRGFANRLYYALFAAAHADLVRSGLPPRALLGTWSHAELPVLLRRHATTDVASVPTRARSAMLRRARFLREIADYRPHWAVDSAALTPLSQHVSAVLEPRP